MGFNDSLARRKSQARTENGSQVKGLERTPYAEDEPEGRMQNTITPVGSQERRPCLRSRGPRFWFGDLNFRNVLKILPVVRDEFP